MYRTRDKLRERLAEMLQDSFEDSLGQQSVTTPHAGQRHFSPNEQSSLSLAARGYLLSLFRSKQISREQLELIIQYVSLYWDAPVSTADVEDLLDQVVFGFTPEDIDDDYLWVGHRKH